MDEFEQRLQVHVCRCNNCMNHLIDENPQVGVPMYPINSDLKKMVKGNEGEWVCPVCHTDGYLTDDFEGEWELTDPSCEQYRKEIIPDQLYIFKENRIVDPITKKTEVFELTMCYDDYDYFEIIGACITFGYTEKQVSQWIGSGDEIPLMLECLFELEN